MSDNFYKQRTVREFVYSILIFNISDGNLSLTNYACSVSYETLIKLNQQINANGLNLTCGNKVRQSMNRDENGRSVAFPESNHASRSIPAIEIRWLATSAGSNYALQQRDRLKVAGRQHGLRCTARCQRKLALRL